MKAQRAICAWNVIEADIGRKGHQLVGSIANRSETVNVYKKIMVGVDGSEHGAKALREAVTLAQAFKAELHVFHAIRHHYNLPAFPLSFSVADPANQFSNQYTEDKMQNAYEESGRQIIEQAKQQVAAMKISLAGKVVYNLETNLPPPEYVESYAKENKIDLVVVGCTGHHSRARTALAGTVATNIVNKAPCQVLVVR
jgi:nucleotide-binding universal stress UspA family protein